MPGYLLNVKRTSLAGMIQTKYRFGSQWRQYLILFQPESKANHKKSIIIYYHGGGWVFGSPEQFAVNAKFMVDLGYTVVMPSYRRLPFYRYHAIAEDRNLALGKTIQLMKDMGWQDKKIILGGMSAGGNVAALQLYDQASLSRLGLDQSKFAGIMLHGAPLNLEAMISTPVIYSYAGRRSSEMFSLASPISYLKEAQKTPILIIHGNKDGIVNYKSATTFVDRLKNLQPDRIEFHTIENGSHMDIGRWCFEENHSAQLIRKWLHKLEE